MLKLEQIALFTLSLWVFNYLDYSWTWFLILFFAPDVSAAGYLINSKIGARTYNIFHHQGIAILVAWCGYYFQSDSSLFAGILLFSHSAFDRFLGYGLKYPDHFKHTHLGQIGRK